MKTARSFAGAVDGPREDTSTVSTLAGVRRGKKDGLVSPEMTLRPSGTQALRGRSGQQLLLSEGRDSPEVVYVGAV